jgi:predicted nucleic acid-binding Zn ribbon protein
MDSCRWCGASISPRDAVCSRCGARLRRESATCPRCGKEIRSGLVVCPHCGEELLRRRVPWKLFGSLVGLALAAVVVYLVLTMVPLPFDLPFVAAAPTTTPTEVILPPTPTWTATPRPPTATATATATLTPIITATVTVSATATFSPTGTLSPAETATATPAATSTPTESPGFAYAAPRLVEPADESDLPEGQFNLTFGSIIKLTWEPVGTLAEDEWYSVRVTYETRNGQTREQVNWVKQTSWAVPREWYDEVGDDRGVYWSVTVVSGTPGTDESVQLSPASETWMFRWG